MNWTMPVEPLGSAGAAALVAAAPLVLLFVALVVLGWKALRAGIAAAALATLLAVAAFGMPLLLALAAVAHGTLFALVPIAPIVVGAVFVQDVARATGSFDRLRRALASATPDRALQALLVAFGFGALLEGSTGFGAPVAISAGILAGLGFPPLAAAGSASSRTPSPWRSRQSVCRSRRSHRRRGFPRRRSGQPRRASSRRSRSASRSSSSSGRAGGARRAAPSAPP